MKVIEKIEGTVAFIFERGGCRVDSRLGFVFVSARLLAPFADCKVGAAITLKAIRNNDPTARSPYVATEVSRITAPAEPTRVLGQVKWFDEKKDIGFVVLLGDHPFGSGEAFLHGSVCRKADCVPEAGDAVRILVESADKGPKVVSLEFGSDITAAVEAVLFAAQDSVQKPPVKKEGKVRKVKNGKDTHSIDQSPEDLASMAKSACANGGGIIAHALLAAVTPAGSA